MKKLLFLMILGLSISCTDNSNKDIVADEKNETRDSVVKKVQDVAQIEADLKKKGYQTFKYKEGDTTYLMQQYYMVFLKSGPKRNQDSTEAAELQKKHMAHLTRMYEEGYTSLTGPMGDDGDLRGWSSLTPRPREKLIAWLI